MSEWSDKQNAIKALEEFIASDPARDISLSPQDLKIREGCMARETRDYLNTLGMPDQEITEVFGGHKVAHLQEYYEWNATRMTNAFLAQSRKPLPPTLDP